MLEFEGLSKTFRRRWSWLKPVPGGAEANGLAAVQNLQLTVHRGDIFGFLGPNGAGKSTTIRMALGLIHPSAGRVRIGGHDLATSRLRALSLTGAFVESPAFYGYLSGRRNLEIFAGLSGAVPSSRIDEVLDRVGMRERAGDPVRVYSHGMRARLGIASCLLPRPELLILDEPTDGLDPHGIREIRELIVRLARDEGMTVFLSSHMLGEVENLCNRIAVLERGRLILQGELAALQRQYRHVRIESGRPAEAAALLKREFGLDAIPCPERPGERLQSAFLVMPKDSQTVEALNLALVHAGLEVRAIAPEEGWLDRLFLELTTSRESTFSANAMERPPARP